MDQALRAAGYTPVRTIGEADYVICHSAGCFWLPPAPARQKFLLVGPPYWPGRTMRIRLLERAKSNLRPASVGYTPRSWLTRNLWGIYYAVFDFRRNLRILTYGSRYDLPATARGHRAIIVRNQNDGWLTPDLDAIHANNPQIDIIRLPGDHSDIGHHPETYVALLKQL
jgi:hypothetical protein